MARLPRGRSKLPTLSFRLRLTLFFILIVVLPMVALAILVSEIAADSAEGKADARLSAGLRAATSVYNDAQVESEPAARKVAARIDGDADSIAALETGDQAALQALADELVDDEELATVRIADADADTVRAGSGQPVASAGVDLIGTDGQRLGTVTVSTTTSAELLESVEATTGEQAALVAPSGSVSRTVDVNAEALPDSGEAADFEREGEELRIAATEPLGSENLRIALFTSPATEGFFASRPRIAIALIVFFAVALLAVLVVFRSLQDYIRRMLGAAQRIGDGDFTEEVPVNGHDEMAGLASEFNRMSDRLSDQMDQLRRQRVEIESSVRRIGEAFASGLDRQALLAILVETAVGTCDADYGLVALSGHVGAEAEAGEATDAMHDVALAAEQRAMRALGPVELEEHGAYAMASSIGRIGPSESPVGAMTVARQGRPFNRAERGVFLYLLTQASASVENVALHEMVSEQAVTDDLTGLANKRAFREVMDKEAARAARFGHHLSLVILDLDGFKKINDTYGHLQGDEVLRTVGRILNAESRGIDEPARYGGEEFAVALPETGPKGALEVAERIRTALGATTIPLLEGDGRLRVTASLGVATLPGAAADVPDLIAAADAALYDAKRTGKDRVCVAPQNGDGQPYDHGNAEQPTAQGPASARRT